MLTGAPHMLTGAPHAGRRALHMHHMSAGPPAGTCHSPTKGDSSTQRLNIWPLSFQPRPLVCAHLGVHGGGLRASWSQLSRFGQLLQLWQGLQGCQMQGTSIQALASKGTRSVQG